MLGQGRLPGLIAEMSWQYELSTLKSILDQHSQFVIKPDGGAGGGGIFVITDKIPVGYKKSSGLVTTQNAIEFHCQDILSGMYSLAWTIQCAVERSHSSVGENPIRQGSFQSVAVGTVSRMLAEQLPDVKGSLRDSASKQAVTSSEH